MKHLYEAVLLTVPGIGDIRLKKLKEKFGAAVNVWKAGRRELQESGCLGATEVEALCEMRERLDCAGVEKDWLAGGIRVCSLSDAEYPELLSLIHI